jgi:hypothetical protein
MFCTLNCVILAVKNRICPLCLCVSRLSSRVQLQEKISRVTGSSGKIKYAQGFHAGLGDMYVICDESVRLVPAGKASGTEQAVGRLLGAMCAITARDDDAQSAMLASWISQVRILHPIER